MEIVLTVVAVWIVLALALALLLGRFLRVADRRERATLLSGAPMPAGTRHTRGNPDDTGVHETA